MNLGTLVCWYIGTLIIEALTYGAAGYLIFKLLKGEERYWIIGALITSAVFIVWDSYLMNSILNWLEISIGNKFVLQFLGKDAESIFRTDLSDIIVAFIQIICGFKIAQILARKLQKS